MCIHINIHTLYAHMHIPVSARTYRGGHSTQYIYICTYIYVYTYTHTYTHMDTWTLSQARGLFTQNIVLFSLDIGLFSSDIWPFLL